MAPSRRRPPGRAARVLLTLALAGCAPEACSDEDDRRLERQIELLVGPEELAAEAAEEALVRRGASAIAMVETGLYLADASGRARVVRVLARIGDPEALPILEHLAAHDPDPDVRGAAGRAAATLAGGRGAATGPP